MLPVPWVLPEQQARLEHWVLVTLRELQVAEVYWEPEGLPAVVASLHLSVRRVLPEPKAQRVLRVPPERKVPLEALA